MLYSTAPGKKAPYFPFMKNHVPKHKAETLREDGTALVCTFCYHSVMSQWSRYQDSSRSLVSGGVPGQSPSLDPSSRVYNFSDYICYVCGVTTYRKRIRALRVMDYPFLRHHKTKKGVITMENGEMVAVCLDCFERLRGQFSDGAKYGIPVDKRQYNWIQIPPPPLAAGDNTAPVSTSAAVSAEHQYLSHYPHKQQQQQVRQPSSQSLCYEDKRQRTTSEQTSVNSTSASTSTLILPTSAMTMNKASTTSASASASAAAMMKTPSRTSPPPSSSHGATTATTATSKPQAAAT